MRRVYSIPALRGLSEWNSALATSSGLGFDTILLTLLSRNVFSDRIAADLAFAKLVALAADRSLKIILEVSVSAVPATSQAAGLIGLSESDIRTRDPRIPPAERQNLPIPFSDGA